MSPPLSRSVSNLVTSKQTGETYNRGGALSAASFGGGSGCQAASTLASTSQILRDSARQAGSTCRLALRVQRTTGTVRLRYAIVGSETFRPPERSAFSLLPGDLNLS